MTPLFFCCFGVRRLDAAFLLLYTKVMIDWPHSPPHRLIEQGAYMITAGIYRKAHLLNTAERLNIFSRLFFACMHESGWELHAWAMLSNHYHFIASSPSDPGTLRRTISKLHTLSAKELNIQDGRLGRKVWFQYFDAHITFTNSYLPRLKYVHNNPVHHGVVSSAVDYQWCSAAWFARNAPSAFQQTVQSFKTDTISLPDSFDVISPMLSTGSESGVEPPRSKSADQRNESGVEPPHSKSADQRSESGVEPPHSKSADQRSESGVEPPHSTFLPP